MKKYPVLVFFSFLLSVSCSAYGPTGAVTGGVYVGAGDIGINYFYDYLSPWGTWVDFSPYGYVWCPTGLGFGWHPYSEGHWVWTDDGWTWISDFDWGWVPFHYGRWDFDDTLGWFWVPGTTWGPAWVTWCWGDAYIGWAPLPPYAEFVAGVGITGFGRPLPDRFWCFVGGSRFLDRDLRGDIFPFERNRVILGEAIHRGNLGFANQRVFNGGVGLEDVRRWTGRQVTRHRLENEAQPGRTRIEGNAVRIYRPPVLRSESARPRAFVPRSEAPQRLQENRRQSANERAMRENQNRQRQLMEQSQQQERDRMKLQHEEEMRRAANQAERQRMQRDYQARQQEMQRRQSEERSRMQQRHETERKSAQGAPRGGKGRGKG
jgi:hypothetical protein